MKTLQDQITEKFNAGEGEQELPVTVIADNHTNIEVQIGEGKYSVTGDVLQRLGVEAADVAAVESDNGAGDGSVEHEVSGTGLVAEPATEASPAMLEILQHFDADDVQHVGEALVGGADTFRVLRNDEVVGEGTIAELQAQVAGVSTDA